MLARLSSAPGPASGRRSTNFCLLVVQDMRVFRKAKPALQSGGIILGGRPDVHLLLILQKMVSERRTPGSPDAETQPPERCSPSRILCVSVAPRSLL